MIVRSAQYLLSGLVVIFSAVACTDFTASPSFGPADSDFELEVVVHSGDQTVTRGRYVFGACAGPGGVCIESDPEPAQ